MADFSAFKITNVGIVLEARVQVGAPLNFTKFMLGDGTFTGNVKNLTALVNPIMEVPVSRIKSQVGDNSKVTIGFDLSSQDVDTGFYLREIGIYAEDPDGGDDILVFYGNAGDTADYIEPRTSATMTEKMIDIEMYIDSVSTITAVIDSSLVYATQDDIENLTEQLNSKAPKEHSSDTTTYGIGTADKYGHNKVINNLTTSAFSNGESLSAYQGYILQQNKQEKLSAGTGITLSNNQLSVKYGTEAGTACQGNDTRLSNSRTPTAHASTATTYGIGTTSAYGHCMTINNLTTSNHADGKALSAYQGYVLNAKFASYLPLAGGTVTGLITANGGIKGALTGNVTGNVTGNCSGSSGSCTGNSGTATKLKTARTINGTNFDGSANITTTKWGTARTFALTGAISGSASVDGSANISITTTQANIKILTGTISLTNGNGQATMNYPTGWTKDNCIGISSTIQYTSSWSPDGNHVNLGSSIILNSTPSSGPTGSKNYKVVLMKIS